MGDRCQGGESPDNIRKPEIVMPQSLCLVTLVVDDYGRQPPKSILSGRDQAGYCVAD
jgi:hypothetical protein